MLQDDGRGSGACQRTGVRPVRGGLPVWYFPGVIGLGTAAAVSTELDGTARASPPPRSPGCSVSSLRSPPAPRIKFRPRTWTPKAGALMALWIASNFVVWGVIGPWPAWSPTRASGTPWPSRAVSPGGTRDFRPRRTAGLRCGAAHAGRARSRAIEDDAFRPAAQKACDTSDGIHRWGLQHGTIPACAGPT
ncbi:hypothetical protein GCM10010402_37960 [Actinomadura luteofluorescens]